MRYVVGGREVNAVVYWSALWIACFVAAWIPLGAFVFVMWVASS